MRYYDETRQNAPQRDDTIAELRRRGYTWRAIAKQVGMSPAGAMLALRRAQAGRPGRDPLP